MKSKTLNSEIVFTIFQQPGMPDEKYEEDLRWVGKDLGGLKSILERDVLQHN